jgi:hypothetical protein
VDVNHVMQCVVAQENQAKDSQSHNQFREGGKEKERTSVALVEDNIGSDDDAEVYVAEWVDTPKGKLVACSFLKPGMGKWRRCALPSMWQSVINFSMFCYKTL